MRHLPLLPGVFLTGGGSRAATIAWDKVSLSKESFHAQARLQTYLVKDVFQLELRQGRAFDIFDCSQLLGHFLPVLFLDRAHPLLLQLFLHPGFVAEIDLSAYNEARDSRAMVMYFREPLLPDVFEGGW